MGWGWLLINDILLGSGITTMVLLMLGCIRREPATSTLALMAQAAGPVPAVTPGPPGLAPAQDRAREEVLQYLAHYGLPALEDLAASLRMTKDEFLRTFFSNGACSVSGQGQMCGRQ